MKKKSSVGVASVSLIPQQKNDVTTLADCDRRKEQAKVTFKEPEKDSLREDSLNRYVEAARVRPLSDFQ